ncbi:MAG: dethiobiotin synthase [Kiritimatiellia bacterium]
METVYFIAGIDTGIGKTVATGLMARFLRHRGIDAITVKLVQTGNEGHSEDIDAHRRICGGGRFYEDELGLTSPQIFRFPASPELAARLEGKTVDLERIRMSVDYCRRNHRVVLVEAAGGLHVPLTRDLLTIDFAARQGWPTVLVTCGRLGSLNHTLLSVEALKARRMKIAGLVYNYHPDADARIDQDTPARTQDFLSRWGLAAPLVRLPRIDANGVPCGGATLPDFSEIFK